MQKQKYIDELTEELEDRSYPMIGLFLIFIAWVPVIAIGFLIWLVLNG